MNVSLLPAFRLGDGGRLVRDELPVSNGGMTNEDHMKARFSNMAYDDSSKHAINNERLNTEHPGWEIDTELSSPEETIFHNSMTGKVVFSARGTDIKSFQDIKTDALLTTRPFGNWNSIERMQRSMDSFERVKRVYSSKGYSDFEVTGHSLGGGVALHISRMTGSPATVFNPSIPITHATGFIDIPNSRIIRTKHDIVSRGRNGVKGGEILNIPTKDGSRTALSAHKMDHFMKETERPPEWTHESAYSSLPRTDTKITETIEGVGTKSLQALGYTDAFFDALDGNYESAIESAAITSLAITNPIQGQFAMAANTLYKGIDDLHKGNKKAGAGRITESTVMAAAGGAAMATGPAGLAIMMVADEAIGSIEAGISAKQYKRKGDKVMAALTATESALLAVGALSSLVTGGIGGLLFGGLYGLVHVADRAVLKHRDKADQKTYMSHSKIDELDMEVNDHMAITNLNATKKRPKTKSDNEPPVTILTRVINRESGGPSRMGAAPYGDWPMEP